MYADNLKCLSRNPDLLVSVAKFSTKYPSTGNLSSCFLSEEVNWLMQLQFLAPVELFFEQLNGYSFLTRADFLFFMKYSFAAVRLVMCTLFYQDGQIQPFWKVRCLEQYTSWKVRVPKLEKCCISFYLFSFSVSVSVCCECWCAWFASCLCFSLCLEQAQ